MALHSLLDFAMTAAGGNAPPYISGAGSSVMINRLEDERVSLPRAFELVPAVYSCISRIQSSIAGTPLLFSQNEKEIDPAIGNPGWLFSYANAFDTGNDLIEQIVGSLLINGNAYVYLDYMGGKVPVEARCLPGNIVLPKTLDGLVPAYYLVSLPDGSEIKVDAFQILHFRMYSPTHGLLGLSPLQVAMLITRVARNSHRWIDSFYAQGGLVSGYFTHEDSMSQAEREKAQESMIAQRRAGKPVIVPRNLKYERTGLTQNEMQFLETAHWTLNEICMIYRVPPVLMGIKEGGGLSDAGATTDLELYLDMCRKPIGKKIESVINARLLADRMHQSEFGFGWTCEFDYDRDMAQMKMFLDKAKGVAEAVGRPVLLPNEGRDILDREPLDDPKFNEPYEKPEPIVAPAGNGPPDKPSTPRKASSPSLESGGPMTRTAAATSVMRATRDARMATQEKVMRAGVRKLYAERERRAIEQLKRDLGSVSTAEAVTAAIDIDRVVAATASDRALIRKFMERVLRNAGTQELQDLGLRITFNWRAAEAALWLNNRSELVITSTSSTLSALIRKSLGEGILLRETPGELIARVRDSMRESYHRQAETIVRTETVSSYNKGAREAWRQSGVVEGKEWVTAGDSLVRDDHAEADGQVVDLDDLFFVGGELLDQPGDDTHGASAGNTINCRCTAAPIVNRDAADVAMLLTDVFAQ